MTSCKLYQIQWAYYHMGTQYVAPEFSSWLEHHWHWNGSSRAQCEQPPPSSSHSNSVSSCHNPPQKRCGNELHRHIQCCWTQGCWAWAKHFSHIFSKCNGNINTFKRSSLQCYVISLFFLRNSLNMTQSRGSTVDFWSIPMVCEVLS